MKFIPLFMMFLITFSAGAEESSASSLSFRITIHGTGEMEADGRKDPYIFDSIVIYSRISHGAKVEMCCDSLNIKNQIAGRVVSSVVMNRDHMLRENVEQGREEHFAKDDPQVKAYLDDSFAKPIVTLELDEQGNEKKRTYTSAPGAKSIIESGPIEHDTLFHGPYMATENKWLRQVEYRQQPGSLAKGNLFYEKVAAAAGARTSVVKIKGTLKCDKYLGVDGKSVAQNIVLAFDGDESYDLVQKQWTSGMLKQTITMEMIVDGKSTVANEIAEMKFEMLPQAAAGKP